MFVCVCVCMRMCVFVHPYDSITHFSIHLSLYSYTSLYQCIYLSIPPLSPSYPIHLSSIFYFFLSLSLSLSLVLGFVRSNESLLPISFLTHLPSHSSLLRSCSYYISFSLFLLTILVLHTAVVPST